MVCIVAVYIINLEYFALSFLSSSAPPISIQITTSGAPVVGQSGYSLTCGVTGAENLSPSITYQWTKNNGTHTQIQNDAANPRVSFSPLRLSDAGQYTCQATISSPFLSDDITMTAMQDVRIQSEFSYYQSVTMCTVLWPGTWILGH
jgi:hypothetical protein